MAQNLRAKPSAGGHSGGCVQRRDQAGSECRLTRGITNFWAYLAAAHANRKEITRNSQNLAKHDTSNRQKTRSRTIGCRFFTGNHLFAGHHEGAKAWACIASLIETCKLNDVEPFGYLRTTLEAIAQGHPMKRLDELLPGPFATKSMQ